MLAGYLKLERRCVSGSLFYIGEHQPRFHAVFSVGEHQAAVVQAHDFGGEAQAQPAAAAAVGAGERVEALGDFGQRVIGNKAALVVNRQFGAVSAAGEAEADFAAGFGKVDGVVKQVVDGLAQQQRVALHGLRRAVEGNVQLFGLQGGAAFLGGLCGQAGQINGLDVVQAVAVFQAGKFEQAGDELLLFFGVADNAGDQLLLLRRKSAVLQQFQRGLLRGERGFEFVGEA